MTIAAECHQILWLKCQRGRAFQFLAVVNMSSAA
jgi:hypothetical protein